MRSGKKGRGKGEAKMSQKGSIMERKGREGFQVEERAVYGRLRGCGKEAVSWKEDENRNTEIDKTGKETI